MNIKGSAIMCDFASISSYVEFVEMFMRNEKLMEEHHRNLLYFSPVVFTTGVNECKCKWDESCKHLIYFGKIDQVVKIHGILDRP